MQIYLEFALIENFCMDFVLLCAAKAAVKNPVGYVRIAIASAIGSAFAVCFPLLCLGGAAASVVKVGFGFVMAAIGGKFNGVKGYVKFAFAFLAVSFLSGGALIAAFSLADVAFVSGGGYLLSSVPVGIPLFAVVCVLIAVKKIAKKVAKNRAIEVKCKIYLNGRCAACSAFFDSGNKLYFCGTPVSVAPKHVAMRLTDVSAITDFVPVHTVAGEGKMPVFTADKIEIDDGKTVCVRTGVLMGVSPKLITKTVLHSDLWEEN